MDEAVDLEKDMSFEIYIRKPKNMHGQRQVASDEEKDVSSMKFSFGAYRYALAFVKEIINMRHFLFFAALQLLSVIFTWLQAV